MSEQLDALPEGWMGVTLSEIVEICDSERKPINASQRNDRISGKSKDELFPYYGATGQVGVIDDFLSDQEAVLVGEDGAPFLDPNKDKAYLVSGKYWVNNHAHIIRGLEGLVSNKFICHQLNILDYSDFVSGTTRLKLTKSNLEKLPLVICSFEAQTRIVEKLEEVLSDLDNGVAELKAAQTKLTQYRQSLLKSAVEGTLTEEWRKKNQSKITETGEQLLARILKERREQWEQTKLDEFKEKGKNPPKDFQKKYPEPVQPDVSELPELPEGWAWASLSQIGWLDRGRSKHRPRSAAHLYDGPYPFVQTGDIRNSGQYINETNKTYSKAGLAQSKLWPKGTMCITIAANIGETAILGVDACFPDSVVGLVPVLKEQDIEFIEYSFRTIREKLDAEAPATAQKNINLEILSKEWLPLPSMAEQVEIRNKLKEGIEKIDLQFQSISKGLMQSDAQKKNILKEAFSGKLVAQHPEDEPAQVLLEKIKVERAIRAAQPKPKRSKKKDQAKVSVMDKIEDALKAYKAAQTSEQGERENDNFGENSWHDAQKLFKDCGVTNGTDVDRIEELYAEIRRLDKEGIIEIKRVGEYDQIKLKEKAE